MDLHGRNISQAIVCYMYDMQIYYIYISKVAFFELPSALAIFATEAWEYQTFFPNRSFTL